ncbi:alpha/beta fold hydrolase [Candidatus Foliamicus sp.]
MRNLLGFVFALFSCWAQADALRTEMIKGGGGLPIALTSNGGVDAPSIVFVHGFLASTLNWHKQMESDLAQQFRLLALDMRGHGASAKPWQEEHYLDMQLWADDVKAALDSGSSVSPVLVAWSYGGYFVMDYIRHYGTDAIGGIVFVSTNAGFVPRPKLPMTPEREAQIARSVSANPRTLLKWTQGYLGIVASEAELPAAEMQMLEVSAMMTPHYVRPFYRKHRTDNSDLLESTDVPVLFIVGGRDPLANLEQIESIAAELPDARVSVYAESGNMPFWFAPEKFNADIMAFANSLSRR